MRSGKNIAVVIFICCLLIGTHVARASLGGTTEDLGRSAMSAGTDLVKLPVHLVETIGYTLKLVGEVIVFPFTLL